MNKNKNKKFNTVSKLTHHIKLDLVVIYYIINCGDIIWKIICHRNNNNNYNNNNNSVEKYNNNNNSNGIVNI